MYRNIVRVTKLLRCGATVDFGLLIFTGLIKLYVFNRLQGSVCVQVNAGPLAYANAFLDPTLAPMYPDDMVEKLKNIFK